MPQSRGGIHSTLSLLAAEQLGCVVTIDMFASEETRSKIHGGEGK